MNVYVKKPKEYNAIQFTGDNELEVMKLLQFPNIDINVDWNGNKMLLLGREKAFKGDWIIMHADSTVFDVVTDKQLKNIYRLKEEVIE